MKKGIWIFLFFLLLTSLSSAFDQKESYIPTRSEWLEIRIGNYLAGFKDYNTTIAVDHDLSVEVGIYYDPQSQVKSNAEQLKDRLTRQIPQILNQYSWARDSKLLISIYEK